ncbi:flagellar biosynthesis protein FlhG [Bacillus pakistanensis]|uniref:Flagellar biosynthesis protein FlhG n=1 Tax=Rossellomorea pakistanensis TaxID=992288 RepID=A0ABS2NG74_9BACI|nr:MinD/ParA family protein [Bacillus pakistanensis]MBM7586851.1 flagellar biosynthesis protein FlhG [Bacillus pakistanensis]
MKDQAETLRLKLSESKSIAKTIGIVSGKGGVGKSNVSVNFSLSLSQKGNKVLLFDLDIGMGNVHLLLGGQAKKSMATFMNDHDKNLNDIIYHSKYGISYISGGSGLNEMTEWNKAHIEVFLCSMQQLQARYDFIIFDMGAGASINTLNLLMSVDDLFIVTTPETTSMTDAYSMIKFMHLKDPQKNYFLICNRAFNIKEGNEIVHRLQTVGKKFLNKDLTILGVLPEDSSVRKAVNSQIPFLLINPRSKVSTALQNLTNRYLLHQDGINVDVSLKESRFFEEIRKLFFMR